MIWVSRSKAKNGDDWVKILHDGTGEFSLGVEKKIPGTAKKWKLW